MSSPQTVVGKDLSLLRVDKFLVTVFYGRLKKLIVWDTREELAIDHPAVHVLVHNEDGLFVKNLKDNNSVSLTSDDCDGKKQITLDAGAAGRPELKVSLRVLSRCKAVHLKHMVGRGLDLLNVGRLYYSVGMFDSVHSHEPLKSKWLGRVGHKKIFFLRQTKQGVLLKSHRDGLVLKCDGKEAVQLFKAQEVALSLADLNCLSISLDVYWWRVNRVKIPMLQPEGDFDDERDKETLYFAQLSKKIAMAAILTTFFLWLFLPKMDNSDKKAIEPAVVSIKRFRTIEAPPEPKVVELKPVENKPEQKVAKKIELPKAAPAPKVAALKPKKEIRLLQASKPLTLPVAKTLPKAPKQLARVAAPKSPVVRAKPSIAAAAPSSRVAPKAPPVDSVAVQAKSVAASLDFLSSAPKNIAKSRGVTNEAASDERYQTKSNKLSKGGKSVLVAMADNQGGGRADVGAINTKSARNIASSTGIADGNPGGSAGGRGKALNDVQGRVSLNALYTGSGDGTEIGKSLGGGGLSMAGEGSIPESVLMKILSKHLQKFQYCYEKALLSNSSLAGNLTMQWTIVGSGQSKDIKVVRSQLNNGGLHNCISKELASISFPQPKGGSVMIKYPFSFSSTSL